MKRILIALAFLAFAAPALAQGTIVGPGQQVLCPLVAQLAPGPTTITQIVSVVGGERIYICGWHVTNTGATGTFSFQSGTGSNCGTNTFTMIPTSNVTSTAPSADHIDYAYMQTPLSSAFCVTPSVATISVVVYYNQF